MTQFCGKDNLRQQTAMWQAMLMAAGISQSKRVYVNGFVMVGGQKMSKSIGNVIDPMEMVEKFGTDGTRYLLVSMGSFGEDSDTSWEKLIEIYNADLANGIGNLASRIVTLYKKTDKNLLNESNYSYKIGNETLGLLEEGKLENILASIRIRIAYLDGKIEEAKPWELPKVDMEKFEEVMAELIGVLYEISIMIKPFMPEISEKIQESLRKKEKINLFPRIK